MRNKDWHELTTHCDFEFRAIAKEMTLPKVHMASIAKYFKQIGKRLAAIKGMDEAEQKEMVALTECYTTQNFFEFGERLVGLNNPFGLLTMQMIASVRSDLATRQTFELS